MQQSLLLYSLASAEPRRCDMDQMRANDVSASSCSSSWQQAMTSTHYHPPGGNLYELQIFNTW